MGIVGNVGRNDSVAMEGLDKSLVLIVNAVLNIGKELMNLTHFHYIENATPWKVAHLLHHFPSRCLNFHSIRKMLNRFVITQSIRSDLFHINANHSNHCPSIYSIY